MARAPRRILGGLMLTALMVALTGGSTLAVASTTPAGTLSPLGAGATDTTGAFSGSVKGLVHAALLADGSVRVRSVLRGAPASASYRVILSSTSCGQAAANKALLIGDARVMGTLVTRTIPAGRLPDRMLVYVSVRVLRVGTGQVACAEALSYALITGVAAPALILEDILVSSFTRPGRPRGLLVTTRPDSASPQLRWSLTGLSGVPSYRLVGSTAPCGTASTPATEAYRSALQTKPYGFTEVTGLDIQVESFRILAKGGKQLACTGRGRHVGPLL